MAINVYSGVMGSGKSYEAVSSLILPAVAAGRRVVSNIDGLNEEAIHAYIESNPRKFGVYRKDASKTLGSIFIVSNERILEPHFFPDGDLDNFDDCVVRGGDFVVIDEAWRFWPSSGRKLSNEHEQFFKMHRHYADPTSGVTCDLALIIQDISGLDRVLKAVVEMTVRTTKLKSVGLYSRYRVDIYEGHRLTKSAKTSSHQKKYDKRIFPLYKSYGSDGAKEVAIDNRQNIFSGMKALFILAMIVLFIGLGLWKARVFFSPKGGASPSLLRDQSAASSGQAAVPSPSAKVIDGISDVWRVVGTATVLGDMFVVLRAVQSGHLRYEPYSNFVGNGVFLNGVVDGKRVSTYSGQTVEQK